MQLQPDIIVARISHTMHSIQCNKNTISTPSSTAPNELSVTAPKSQPEIHGSQDIQIVSPLNPHTTKISRTRMRKREELITRYRVPIWALKWAWDIELLRSRSGWTIRLNPTNLISYGSPVWKAISRNDLTSLRELFDRGQASISDRFENHTLLEVRCCFIPSSPDFYVFPRFGAYLDKVALGWNILAPSASICRFLFDRGADPDGRSDPTR